MLALVPENTASDAESPQQLLASLAAVAVIAGARQFTAPSFLIHLLTCLLAVASYVDLKSLKIPNWLTYTATIVAIVLNGLAAGLSAWTGMATPAWLGAIGFGPSLLGAGTGLAVMLVIYALSGRGAGDVKLAAAIGAIVGPIQIVAIILYTHLMAGIFVLVWITLQVGAKCLMASGGWLSSGRTVPVRVGAPASKLADLLARPVPLAGFFAFSSILVLGGLIP